MVSRRLSVDRRRWWSPPVLLVATVGVVGAAVGEECQPGWISGGAYPGVRGSVSAAVPWDVDGPGPEPERLLIAGEFDLIGDDFVEDFAFWDGERISATPLPALNRLFERVDTAFVYQGELYLGGQLPCSGAASRDGGPGNPCAGIILRVVRWRDGAWESLPLPLETQFWSRFGSVADFGVYGGVLHAIAVEASSRRSLVLRQNGGAFEIIGRSGDGDAFALAEFAGELVVAGDFARMNDWSIRGLAAWNGSAWRRFDPLDRPRFLNDVLVFGGDLYVSGTLTNSSEIGEVVRFDGTTFRMAGGGIRGFAVRLGSYNGEIIAAGDGLWTPSWAAQRGSIMRLENQNWWPVIPEFGFAAGPINVVTEYDGELIFAGGFGGAGGKRALRLARSDGGTVRTFGDGLDAPIRALESTDGQQFVGGEFGAMNVNTNPLPGFSVGVERRVGVNGGAAGRPDNDVLGFAGVDSGLYMLGEFNLISGQSRGRIARWDGGGWGALPSPELTTTGGARQVPELLAAAEWRDRLYVGGSILEGSLNPGVLVREGDSWAIAGSPNELYGTVTSLTVYQDRLFAAGAFDGAVGANIRGLAAFDGMQWLSPGARMLAGGKLAIHDGELIAAGAVAFGSTTASVAAFDGSAWRALAAGATPVGVTAVRSVEDVLYAAGDSLLPSDATNPQQLFRWDGSTWSAIPGVLHGRVEAIAEYDGRIVVGGEFDAIDGVASAYIAEFGCESSPRPGDLDCDGFATVADIPAFVLALLDPAGYGEQYPNCDAALADTNDDGFVTVADIGRFVERLTL